MVSDQLEMNKYKVHHAPGDADFCEESSGVYKMVDTVLVSDDTICSSCTLSHAWTPMADFRPEPTMSIKNPRVWNIKTV